MIVQQQTLSELKQLQSNCFIILCYQDKLSEQLDLLEANVAKYCEAVIEHEAFKAELNQLLITHPDPKSSIKKIVFMGLGVQEEALPFKLKKALGELFAVLTKQKQDQLDVLLSYEASHLENNIIDEVCRAFYASQYKFNEAKSQKSKQKKKTLNVISLSEEIPLEKLKYLHAEAMGIAFAKDLANQACNICTPPYLAEKAQALSEAFTTIETYVVNQEQLFDLGMHAYLSVNQASIYQASMPVIKYTSKEAVNPPIVFVGKGVTFDTGGITLKKADGMQHMIYDMCGAATVLGLIKSVAELELPVNIIGILATAENAIDGNAYRPGDVISTMQGTSVEIISTDAEGRLLLCDAISYAKRFEPQAIIDIATLTGAAITALGHQATGLMSNCEELAESLLEAGEKAYDRAWQFPIWKEYGSALKSQVADLKNSGNNSPGMITAGYFLSEFAQNQSWAHLDIAGTAFHYGKQNTATGRPIPLLLEYLSGICQSGSS